MFTWHEFTACIHPKMLIYKSRRHERDAVRLSLSMRVDALFYKLRDNGTRSDAGKGGNKKRGGGVEKYVCLTCYLGRDIINVASTIAWFLTRVSKIEPTGRLVYRVYRSIYTARFSPSLFHVTLIAPRRKMHRRCIDAYSLLRCRSARFAAIRNRWTLVKKYADVDRYRCDKSPSFSRMENCQENCCNGCTLENLILRFVSLDDLNICVFSSLFLVSIRK